MFPTESRTAFFFLTPGTASQNHQVLEQSLPHARADTMRPLVLIPALGPTLRRQSCRPLHARLFQEALVFWLSHTRTNWSRLDHCDCPLLLWPPLVTIQFYATDVTSSEEEKLPTPTFVFNFVLFHVVQNICAPLCSRCLK